MFSSSWNLADFETVISGALPSPNATTGVQGHTTITISYCLQRAPSKRTDFEVDEIRTHDASFCLLVIRHYPL